MQVLKDNKPESELIESGYTVFEQLSPEIVDQLSDFYQTLKSPYDSGFHPTMFWEDANLRISINQFISSTLKSWVEKHFHQHKILYGNFMVKEPGESSNMKLHQDWSYVDEKFHKSFALWFPLQDLTKENGALSVISGSHLFQNHDRGPGVKCPFEENEEHIIQKYGHSLYLAKGQPVVWEHHLLHYSPPNFSSKPRIAVTAIIVPTNAELYHYYKNDAEPFTYQFKIKPTFYDSYKIGQPPNKDAEFVTKFTSEKRVYDLSELRKILSDKTKKNGQNWLSRLKKLIS